MKLILLVLSALVVLASSMPHHGGLHKLSATKSQPQEMQLQDQAVLLGAATNNIKNNPINENLTPLANKDGSEDSLTKLNGKGRGKGKGRGGKGRGGKGKGGKRGGRGKGSGGYGGGNDNLIGNGYGGPGAGVNRVDRVDLLDRGAFDYWDTLRYSPLSGPYGFPYTGPFATALGGPWAGPYRGSITAFDGPLPIGFDFGLGPGIGGGKSGSGIYGSGSRGLGQMGGGGYGGGMGGGMGGGYGK